MDMLIGVAPRAARVVHAHRLVHFNLAAHCFRRRQRNFAERHPKVGMQFAVQVNLLGIQELSLDRMNRIYRIGTVRFFRTHFVHSVSSVCKTKKPYAENAWLRCWQSGSDSSLPSAALPAS